MHILYNKHVTVIISTHLVYRQQLTKFHGTLLPSKHPSRKKTAMSGISNTDQPTMDDAPPPLKSSPLKKTYSEVLNSNYTVKMPGKSFFVKIKDLTDSKDFPNDDDTVPGNINTFKYHSQRMNTMFQVPKLEEDAVGNKTALLAINKMNQMI